MQAGLQSLPRLDLGIETAEIVQAEAVYGDIFRREIVRFVCMVDDVDRNIGTVAFAVLPLGNNGESIVIKKGFPVQRQGNGFCGGLRFRPIGVVSNGRKHPCQNIHQKDDQDNNQQGFGQAGDFGRLFRFPAGFRTGEGILVGYLFPGRVLDDQRFPFMDVKIVGDLL